MMPSPYIPPPSRPNRTFSGVNLSSPQSSSRKFTPTSGPIEAGSLSSITPIADDPPLQFIVPPLAESSREEKYPRPALMLYFVRVPGSRDLILTSMHPLKSTITAQDVEGCLYYVHVHGEGEGSQGQSQGQGGMPPSSTTGSMGNVGSGSGRRRWGTQILHRPGQGEGMKDFSMTVIRRDPATGAQWNVAHISSTVAGVQMLSQSGTSPPPPPIVISLPGRGYKKFMSPESVVWDCAAPGAGDNWWKRGMSKTKNHLRPTSSVSMRHGHNDGGSGGSWGEQDKKEKDHWKGYAFDALWTPVGNSGRGEKMGTCRFKDAAGGKIMKCKYYPANGRPSYLVSAMEFKLPSSGGFHHRSRSASPSISTRKTKMGTFVVHNVGMEMLDLVISANVGMFWRKWEGWVGERGALGQ
ncbi:hypothetical protein EV426DRAFT_563105 [Tirmania nivea]|nr:hypothetical protein EV426DRAFT_563105 [Tirmania nivea]